MTLRLRLVLAVVALMTVGLAIFGVVTYELYSRSEYSRLDDQLANSIPLVTNQLYDKAGLSGQPSTPTGEYGGGGPYQGGRRPAPPPDVPPSTYAELRGPTGAVLSSVQLIDQTSQPELPADLEVPATGSRVFTTGSVDGSGDWRVSVARRRRRRRQRRRRRRPVQRGARSRSTGSSSSRPRRPAGAARRSWRPARGSSFGAGLRPLEQMAHVGPLDHRRRPVPTGARRRTSAPRSASSVWR